MEPCCGKLEKVSTERNKTTGTTWTTYRCKKCRRMQVDAEVAVYGWPMSIPYPTPADEDGA